MYRGNFSDFSTLPKKIEATISQMGYYFHSSYTQSETSM
jgi:hypothetical protein